MSPRPRLAILVVLTALAACGPAGQGAAEPPAVVAPATGTAPVPAAAAGKIGAGQVGRISPVPAFKGGGVGWQMEIQSLGEMRHRVHLASGPPPRSGNGTVVYQPAPVPTPILLTGTLYVPGGDRALRITLTTRACSDDAGRQHRHAVQVDVAGEPALHGCGDLAVY